MVPLSCHYLFATIYLYPSGITGKDIRNVAAPREGTCEDCPEAAGGSGSCNDNILEVIVEQDKLTSGYTEDVWVDGTRVGKPSGVGKCLKGSLSFSFDSVDV